MNPPSNLNKKKTKSFTKRPLNPLIHGKPGFDQIVHQNAQNFYNTLPHPTLVAQYLPLLQQSLEALFRQSEAEFNAIVKSLPPEALDIPFVRKTFKPLPLKKGSSLSKNAYPLLFHTLFHGTVQSVATCLQQGALLQQKAGPFKKTPLYSLLFINNPQKAPMASLLYDAGARFDSQEHDALQLLCQKAPELHFLLPHLWIKNPTAFENKTYEQAWHKHPMALLLTRPQSQLAQQFMMDLAPDLLHPKALLWACQNTQGQYTFDYIEDLLERYPLAPAWPTSGHKAQHTLQEVLEGMYRICETPGFSKTQLSFHHHTLATFDPQALSTQAQTLLHQALEGKESLTKISRMFSFLSDHLDPVFFNTPLPPPDQQNWLKGWYPLHYASALYAEPDFAHILLNKGSSPHCKNLQEQTPLDLLEALPKDPDNPNLSQFTRLVEILTASQSPSLAPQLKSVGLA